LNGNEVYRQKRRAFIERMALRYPDRKTSKSLLFAEIVSGSDLEDRASAAHYYHGCKGGLKSFIRIIEGYENQYAQDPERLQLAVTDWPKKGPEREFLCNLLIAIGFMETKEAADYLGHVAFHYKDRCLNADAVEGIAFLGDLLDVNIPFALIGPEQPIEMILSALYAMMCSIRTDEDWDRIRAEAPRLFAHPYRSISYFLFDVLQMDARNLDLIEPMLEHSDPKMRSSAQEAIEQIRAMEDDSFDGC